MTVPTSLGATYRDLISPAFRNLSAPFRLAWQDLSGSVVAVYQTKSPEPENYEKCLKATFRIALGIGLAFFHRYAWKQVKPHFGPLGSMGCSLFLNEAGHWLDPKANYIGASAWFLFKGTTSFLKDKGSSRYASAYILGVQERKFDATKGSRLFDNSLVHGSIYLFARLLARGHQKWLSYRNPTERV